MGQEEHKTQVKLCPTEHSITMHCSISLQINSLLKGCFISCVSSPICQCMKQYCQLHTLKSFWVDNWKYIHPICAAQLLGCYSQGKNPTIRYSSSTEDKATLLFKQSFFLPFHTHNPLSRITVASTCTWEAFPLYHLPPPSSFSLLFCSPKHRFCTNVPSLCSCTLLYTSLSF